MYNREDDLNAYTPENAGGYEESERTDSSDLDDTAPLVNQSPESGDSEDSYKYKSDDLTDSVYRREADAYKPAPGAYRQPEDEARYPQYSVGQYTEDVPETILDNNRFDEQDNLHTNKQEKKKNGGKGTYGKFVAIAIVCSLVVGTVGGYIGSGLRADESSGSATSITDTVNSPSTDNSGTTATNTAVRTGEQMTASEIYELASQQVVGITSGGTISYYGQTVESQSMGTGFIISEDGYIITNYHVVSNSVSGGSVTVSLKNGDSYEAEYVGGYEAGDVALLKIDATGLNTVTLGDSNNITVGEDIYVVGNALGEYDYTLTSGLISGLDREMTFEDSSGGGESINMFQLDAAVNSGNSGGPVYNSYGQVIGIVTSKISSSTSSTAASVEGLGFAIPINDATSIVNDIKTKGYVEGDVLIGVSLRTVDSTVIQNYGIPSGVYVDAVTSGGAAEKAGVQAKDIITKLDDKEITSVSDLKQALKNYSVGDSATATLYRSGETIGVTVTFTETQTTDTSASASTDTDSSQQDDSGSSQRPDSSSGYGGFSN